MSHNMVPISLGDGSRGEPSPKCAEIWMNNVRKRDARVRKSGCGVRRDEHMENRHRNGGAKGQKVRNFLQNLPIIYI